MTKDTKHTQEIVKEATTQTTKKFYKSKLNIMFATIFGVGTLIINDPQLLEVISPQIIGSIAALTGFAGVIIRTFFTKEILEK